MPATSVIPKPSWVAAASPSPVSESLARELHLPEPIARLLIARGFNDIASATSFLRPELTHLHDPYAMHGMQPAVGRIRAALLAHEPILIYGDYDVDGTVATVLLKTAIERTASALKITPDIRYHIPHRIREGYGMRESRIAAAAAEGVRLVISVDTGIRAHAAAEEAARLSLDLIVTDHHLPDELNGSPRALAVLNPNQPHCDYPCKDLCGAAVAFKLAQALLEGAARHDSQSPAETHAQLDRLRGKTLPSFLKLLAVATIADSVPLTGENRTIAHIGLRELRTPAQPGLRALMELAGIDITRPISATDVGFRLAPRLNAAGRMEVASDVVELFLTRDPATARALAEKLHRLNDDRRATEANALREIEAQIESLFAATDGLPACLVLDDAPPEDPGDPSVSASSLPVGPQDAKPTTTGWHRGVVGILASRVVDRTGRPALVIAHEDGIAHGSGRSIRGFHLLDALTLAHEESAGTLFSRFGGHAHAVGFALPSSNVPQLRESLARIAARQLDLTTEEPFSFDLELRFAEITPDLLDSFEQLAPFGLGNPEPIFVTRHARLLTPPRTLAERHLRLSFEDHDGAARFSGVAWSGRSSRRTCWPEIARTQSWSPGDYFDLAYHLRRNWHPDFGGWELEILALHRL